MDKLLIIDGTNLLFQMFFGMPSRIINKEGKAIQGTLGFIGALKKIIAKTNPSHLVVLFDDEKGSERTLVNQDYKANRPDYSTLSDQDNPFTQLQDVYNALDYLKIKHTESYMCETDDLIASYALTYGNNLKVVISSFDSDFFQLINENVTIFRYRGDKSVTCDCDYIREKYNICPSVYADFKSLTGDSADNIKGACKVGPKTASQLINAYGSLENLLNNADKIEKSALKQSICECKERLKDNYKIIKLSNCHALPFDISELKYTLPSIPTKDILRAINL